MQRSWHECYKHRNLHVFTLSPRRLWCKYDILPEEKFRIFVLNCIFTGRNSKHLQKIIRFISREILGVLLQLVMVRRWSVLYRMVLPSVPWGCQSAYEFHNRNGFRLTYFSCSHSILLISVYTHESRNLNHGSPKIVQTNYFNQLCVFL